MLSTLVISLREFLEAFLIIGVFFGISRKLQLKREKEILLAAVTGVVISLLLPIAVFLIGDKIHVVLNEKNADLIAGYLMIFSGFFIAYVIFSLHNMFRHKRSEHLLKAHEKLQHNIFDVSLFLTIVFIIIREGFEIALFTATTSLFSTFVQNLAGLMIGFGISALIGVFTSLAYIKFSIGKIFKLTEYGIVLLGASFVNNGLGELIEVYFDIHISDVFPIKLMFLPDHETILGNFFNTMFGLRQEFSLVRVAIMVLYVAVVYLLFFRRRPSHHD